MRGSAASVRIVPHAAPGGRAICDVHAAEPVEDLGGVSVRFKTLVSPDECGGVRASLLICPRLVLRWWPALSVAGGGAEWRSVAMGSLGEGAVEAVRLALMPGAAIPTAVCEEKPGVGFFTLDFYARSR